MSCGAREARAVPRLHQPTPPCVDAATNANDPRHLCDRCRSGRQRLRREPGGKVTRDHSDVETPQDRLLGLAIKQELKRSLDAMLRRMHSHRQSFASVSCHRDVMASLARSHTDHDLEFEWIAFAGSLDLDHSLPSS